MISIITPFHNAQKTLTACIESVLVQTETDWELILVNDGSADGSVKLAQSYCGQDPRIRLLTQEQRGVSEARNAGLSEAQGEFVSFLDADDRIAPNMLGVLLALIRTYRADMAGCSFLPFAEPSDIAAAEPEAGSVPPGAFFDPVRTEIMTGADFVLRGILSSDTRIWSKLIRRSCIGRTHFRRSYTIGEDMLFLLALTKRLGTVVRTEARLYYYYSNPAGAMQKPYTPQYMDQLRCWEAAGRWIREERSDLAEDSRCMARLAAIRAVSAMLIAGKLARLAEAERMDEAETTETLRQTVRECLAVPGVQDFLPKGYGIKTRLFRLSPALYYAAYGRWKRG
ncbi:glycosyltransferase family 2 protein [Lachnoclostridium sp. Marseille-P6806]|uniref:glycosyltransferase family 2 protein n=1 Tax=Lachnoclostridium sp. Marseille-P6806 TaxID=2364793 RepID=UPI001030CDC5|nr:glycosyltransferase [Lachnoclostridium sp. Marseille-P6806]